MKTKIILIVFIFLSNILLSQSDSIKIKINYGLTLSGLSAFTFNKNFHYYKGDVENYPLFYNLGFYINKKRHSFDIGIANQIANINADYFYYSLCYSYRFTKTNKIIDIAGTIKTLSSLYQIHNPTKEVKQYHYNDMLVCIGPTLSKQINRITLQLNLFYTLELPIYVKQYTNGQLPTLNADKPQYIPTLFMTELKLMYQLNKKHTDVK